MLRSTLRLVAINSLISPGFGRCEATNFSDFQVFVHKNVSSVQKNFRVNVFSDCCTARLI